MKVVNAVSMAKTKVIKVDALLRRNHCFTTITVKFGEPVANDKALVKIRLGCSRVVAPLLFRGHHP